MPVTVNMPLDELRAALGGRAVLERDEAIERYGENTLGDDPADSMIAAVCPESTDEVVSLVRIAGRHQLPIYPVSTGRNWGYGCALPASHGCILADLSGMNAVVGVDTNSDTVTVQPGVTQQMLRDYLDERGLAYMVPTTGAGPTCSLVGNALERGYGGTPHVDHFGAVTAIEAVLPDGQIYHSGLWHSGNPELERAHKWGVGPYIDGLFAQGSLGIVTQMTLRLAPLPDQVAMFYFSCRDDSSLEDVTAAVRSVQRRYGANISGINLTNARRMIAMMSGGANRGGRLGCPMDQATLHSLMQRHGIHAWTGFGAIYGPARVVRAVQAGVRKELRPSVDRFHAITLTKARVVQRILRYLPSRWTGGLRAQIDALIDGLQVLSGVPREVALPLAYWRSGNRGTEGPLNPASDGCGVMWYSPLVPMRPSRVREFVSMIHEVCPRFGIEPIITFASVAEGCFDSPIPLLFDRSDPEQVSQAKACYEELVRQGLDRGFVPYRLPRGRCELIADCSPTFWDTVSRIKAAIDPQNIIAPGRYSVAG